MASFLDSSGDIILDAVLTDYGRQLLAKGDGSFNIVKFAFADDEIDYSRWDATATTTLKDVDILSTPVLEAFTNNAASMKSKLLTIGIENLLYLPVLKLNEGVYSQANYNNLFNGFVVPLNRRTPGETTSVLVTSNQNSGLLNADRLITIDQGLDTGNLDQTKSLLDQQPELYEKEYNIIIDNRLGFITSGFGQTPISPVSIDDDNMATYKVSDTTAGGFVRQIKTDGSDTLTILGFQGTRLNFTITPTNNIVTTDALLTRLGGTLNLVAGKPFLCVRTSVTVVGVTTGYSIEIPVLFARYTGP